MPNPTFLSLRTAGIAGIAGVAAVVLSLAPGGAVGAACLRPPVTAPVVDPFRAPACPFCAGNRGLTYAVAPGTPVRAAATGTVTFAGRVAGTGFVVVRHADGRRATYGGVTPADLAAGHAVVAGSLVGWADAGEVHFGLREGDEYVDPAPWLGRFVRRAQLVPTDGTAARPAPPPVLRCPAFTGAAWGGAR